ncbi:hypothetical protein [Vibrio phage vB_VpaP_SJSY21]|nr:hypothetical protein [Vibrio phage vB_VpaP_SJSY21]
MNLQNISNALSAAILESDKIDERNGSTAAYLALRTAVSSLRDLTNKED